MNSVKASLLHIPHPCPPSPVRISSSLLTMVEAPSPQVLLEAQPLKFIPLCIFWFSRG